MNKELDLEAIRQSPRQFVDLETVIALSDRCEGLEAQLAGKDAEIERLKEESRMPVKYYQPDGKGSIYAVYGSSSINFTESLLNKLAASQAREQQLREALTACVCAMQDHQAGIGITGMFDEVEKLGRLVLQSVTQDTSALEAVIAKAGEVMRERCEGVATVIMSLPDKKRRIRAILGVTLGDLK